jgi:hypothetical protein
MLPSFRQLPAGSGGATLLLVVVLMGCTDADPAGRAGNGASPNHPAPDTPPVTQALQPPAPLLRNRSGELLNPEASTVVMLYHDLAGIAPPMDRWVDGDHRVTVARPADKPAARAAVRAELESGMAAVRGVGTLRLTLNANLSDYDPNYGEFTVRALAPSSVVEFKALGHEVGLRFANARAAQLWRVPADQAQSVRDRIGYGEVTADVLLQIQSVHAAPEGGTITNNVIEYELRETRGGTVLGRVQLANQPQETS